MFRIDAGGSHVEPPRAVQVWITCNGVVTELDLKLFINYYSKFGCEHHFFSEFQLHLPGLEWSMQMIQSTAMWQSALTVSRSANSTELETSIEPTLKFMITSYKKMQTIVIWTMYMYLKLPKPVMNWSQVRKTWLSYPSTSLCTPNSDGSMFHSCVTSNFGRMNWPQKGLQLIPVLGRYAKWNVHRAFCTKLCTLYPGRSSSESSSFGCLSQKMVVTPKKKVMAIVFFLKHISKAQTFKIITPQRLSMIIVYHVVPKFDRFGLAPPRAGEFLTRRFNPSQTTLPMSIKNAEMLLNL